MARMGSINRSLVLGTAGHIDHGKTALVRALTGVDTDRLPAEKQRGITIDIGFAPLDLGALHLAIIDVPGHERFVRNMLAGATGLDLALLVVAADDSVMPQTREHLEILRLLKVPAGAIALTKCDLVDAEWLDLVESDLRELVRGTFLESAPIVRTSVISGVGIAALRDTLRVVAEGAPERDDPGLFRMAIDRAFSVAGHGTVVTGTIASGAVSVGDELEWWPNGRGVRVRGLHQHDRAVERLARGARAAINLVGASHDEFRRGQEVATPGYLRASRALTVSVRPTEAALWPLRHRGRYRLHIGTAEVAAILALLDTSFVRPGEGARAQLFLSEPIVAVHGEAFVLRTQSPVATVGGGTVLQPTPRRLRRRDQASIARLGALASHQAIERLEAALAMRGLAPWTRPELTRESGVAPELIGQYVAELRTSGALIDLAIGQRRTVSLLAEAVGELEDRVLRALSRLHEAHPRHASIPRAHVSSQLPDIAMGGVIQAVLDRLLLRRAIVGDDRAVALADHKPRLTQAERQLRTSFLEAIRRGGFAPPDRGELAQSAGQRSAVVPEILTLLEEEGHIVEVAPGFYLACEVEQDLRRRVVDRLKDGSSLTMADLRDLLGTTRKYAVPIGEYLDRFGITRRDGDVRRLASMAPSS